MPFPYVTAAAAALIIILQILLMLSAGMHRAKTKVGVGVAGDIDLERKVRRHGNLAENTGLFLVVLALLEMMGTAETPMIWFAGLFVTARLLHAIGFSSLAGSHMGEGSKLFMVARVLGAMGTAFLGLGLGGFLVYSLLQY